MNCFRHSEQTAVGICKSCQKGLCKDCVTEIDGSLACRNACEDDVAVLNYMIERGRKVYKNLGSQWIPSIIVNGVGGIFFLGFGIYTKNSTLSWLMVGLGLIMIAGGIYSFILKSRNK